MFGNDLSLCLIACGLWKSTFSRGDTEIEKSRAKQKELSSKADMHSVRIEKGAAADLSSEYIRISQPTCLAGFVYFCSDVVANRPPAPRCGGEGEAGVADQDAAGGGCGY